MTKPVFKNFEEAIKHSQINKMFDEKFMTSVKIYNKVKSSMPELFQLNDAKSFISGMFFRTGVDFILALEKHVEIEDRAGLPLLVYGKAMGRLSKYLEEK